MRQLLIFLSLICSIPLTAQPGQQEKLEARKAQIQKEIQENQRLLQSVKTKEKSATTQLIIKREKIKLKERLIETTERQTKALNNDMYLNQLQINRLKRELDDLKADYADMILKSYKSRSEQSRAMFLLSSENFLQAYKRAQYMKQYASYRRSQGEEIKSKQVALQEFNQKLEVQKREKQRLLAENQKERNALEQERKEQEQLVKQIQKDKKQITADIRKKQQESKRIDAQIQKLIRDAIAAANKKTAASEAKSGGAKKATAT
ncbi:MAG TPA: peptidase M23, partial [Flavobacterium sp.]|nr:peptidase M23 [Flavobacterium sp.]